MLLTSYIQMKDMVRCFTNRLDWYARLERFLADSPGGNREPVPDGGIPGSTGTVKE